MPYVWLPRWAISRRWRGRRPGAARRCSASNSLDEALTALQHAISLGDSADDPYNLVRALGIAGIVHVHRGEFEKSREIQTRSVELQERVGVPWGIGVDLACLGLTETLLGDWVAARVHLQRAVNLCTTPQATSWAIFPLLNLAELDLLEGEWNHAATLAAQALALDRGNAQTARSVERILAEIDLGAGRPDAARLRLEAFLGAAAEPGPQDDEILPTLATAYDALDAPARATTVLEGTITRAIAANDRLIAVRARVARARSLGHLGEWQRALEDLDAVIASTRAMPYPYMEARALFERGVLLLDIERRQDGERSLQEALAIFQRLGARPNRDKTEELLGSLRASQL